MLLLTDFIPKLEDEYTLQPEITTNIINYASKSLAHTIFFGGYGTGKNTLAKLLIAKHFNIQLSHLYKKSFIHFAFNEEEYKFIKSNYHFEINVQNIQKQNQGIIPEFILDLSKTVNIYTNKYKIIILNNAEYLSRNIQHQLRRMMEMYNSSCRLIFITHNLSNIDETIQSRCVKINVPYPEKQNLFNLIDTYLAIHGDKIQMDHNDKNINALITKYNYNVTLIFMHLCGMNHNIGVNEIVDINKEYATKLWTQINKKNMSISDVRKILNDISTTCLNYYDIFSYINDKLFQKYSDNLPKLTKIQETINYYFYLYEIGHKKNFQIECLIICLNLLIKNSEFVNFPFYI